MDRNIAKIPPCPKCGSLPGIYKYYIERNGSIKIHSLLCSECRKGPDPLVSTDPILEWIQWATPKKSKL